MKEDLLGIINKYENLIYSIVNKYCYYFDKEDLFQVGIIGLINAYKNYNKEKNTKFSSYAYFYILGEIKKYINESKLVKVSKELSKLNLSINKSKNYLIQKLQREPTDFEISLFLEIPEEKVIEAKEANAMIESLDYIDSEDNCLYNRIKREEQSYNSEILDLNQSVSELDEFSQRLLNERYLLEKTQSETAKELGITQVQVSRKEKEILTRLRERLM